MHGGATMHRDVRAQRHHAVVQAFALAIACAALVFSRKPDAFLDAQFWAEDGVVWYRQAYESGWVSLLDPQNGYFQTVSKVTANLAQLVDLAWAPLLFAGVALCFKVLPVLLLHADRGRQLAPDARCRWLLTALYIAHPYSWEVFINVTNIHWHLAIAALLVVCLGSWDGAFQKSCDVAIVSLCGLSGTFAMFLAPISAWHWYRTRSRRALVLASILALAAGIQLVALATTGTTARSPAPLDASWGDLVRIVGGQVAAASLLGDVWPELFDTAAWQRWMLVPLAFSAALAVLVARAFHSARHPLRYFIALSAMVFVAALLRPQISGTEGQWPLFARPGIGGRYAFLPILAFYASLAWIATADRTAAFRWVARLLLAIVLVVAVPASWRVKPYEDVGFAARAQSFARAAPGEVVEIPVNPPGWSFPLEKR